MDENLGVKEDDLVEEEESPSLKIVIRKMPHSVADPLEKGTEFSFGGWVYMVYDLRSRGRKFIQRLGKIETVEEDPKPAPENEGVEDA